jgi:hypothetical protein
MKIFEYKDSGRPTQFHQQCSRPLVRPGAGLDQPRELTACFVADVQERAQRPRREQRIARSS